MQMNPIRYTVTQTGRTPAGAWWAQGPTRETRRRRRHSPSASRDTGAPQHTRPRLYAPGLDDAPSDAYRNGHARVAGRMLQSSGILFDEAHTSLLRRCIRTTNLVLMEMGQVGQWFIGPLYPAMIHLTSACQYLLLRRNTSPSTNIGD